MKLLSDQVVGGTLIPSDFNTMPKELENAVTGTGQVLASGDANQLGKAIAVYAAGGDFYTDSGDADAYLLTPVGSKQSPPALFNGMRVRFIPDNTNTGASTVNVNGLTATAIKKADGTTALSAGDLQAGIEYALAYDGSVFRIISSPSNPSSIRFTAQGDAIVVADIIQTIADKNCKIHEVHLSVGTVPTGSYLEIDIKIDGVSIFVSGKNPRINAGATLNAPEASPTRMYITCTEIEGSYTDTPAYGANIGQIDVAANTLVKGAYVQMDITHVGSTIPGAKILAAIPLN